MSDYFTSNTARTPKGHLLWVGPKMAHFAGKAMSPRCVLLKHLTW